MIEQAPIKEPLVKGQFVERIWLEYFSSLADGLAGNWYRTNWKVESTGITQSLLNADLVYMGRVVFFNLFFEDLNSSNGKIFTPYVDNNQNKRLTLVNSIGEIWGQSGGEWMIQKGAVISGNLIELPDLSLEQAVIKGIFSIKGK